jgi:hypothetical protein
MAWMVPDNSSIKDFTRIIVTPCQVYNHIRKWKAKWVTVCKLKKLPWVTFDSTRCAIVVDKEEFKQLIMVSFVYHFFDQHVQTTMVY